MAPQADRSPQAAEPQFLPGHDDAGNTQSKAYTYSSNSSHSYIHSSYSLLFNKVYLHFTTDSTRIFLIYFQHNHSTRICDAVNHILHHPHNVKPPNLSAKKCLIFFPALYLRRAKNEIYCVRVRSLPAITEIIRLAHL